MQILPVSAAMGESLVLGLATGPVCLASCGPVVLPWMLAQPEGMRAHAIRLSQFLAGRLCGYMAFAIAAWAVGASIPRSLATSSSVTGGIHLLLAVALLIYAAGWPRPRCAASAMSGRHSKTDLVQIGGQAPQRSSGAMTLGFLTGINLCPPFLIASVRAAQLATLSGAMLFFLFFFAGTSVWFAPFLSLGLIRRTTALVTVARMTAVLLACWYGFSGLVLLIERTVYG
jgi:sulfite exporter TauE/SafE